MFARTKYKLACTATPSPNDYMELGNHSEFLNVLKRSEMLSMFFVHDGDQTQSWRLKGHAESKFWEWVSQWAVVMRSQKDLGYESNYQLPTLEIETIIIDKSIKKDDALFPEEAKTLEERRYARKNSIADRVELAADIVNESDEIYLVWCDYNDESASLRKSIKNAVEITGSDPEKHKEESVIEFAKGNIKCLVTKPSIAGFGINWQICHNIIYCGLSDSFEMYYQSVRRCYRYGQKKDVKVRIIISNAEMAVLENIKRKEKEFDIMMDEIVKYTAKHIKKHLKKEQKNKNEYLPEKDMRLPKFLGGVNEGV